MSVIRIVLFYCIDELKFPFQLNVSKCHYEKMRRGIFYCESRGIVTHPDDHSLIPSGIVQGNVSFCNAISLREWHSKGKLSTHSCITEEGACK